MTQAIIYARVASQHSNLDTKIDNLVNYCSNHKLSIIKEYPVSQLDYLTDYPAQTAVYKKIKKVRTIFLKFDLFFCKRRTT